MTKIILTQEQADRIEHFKKRDARVTAIETHMGRGWSTPVNVCLRELSNAHFINSLYVDDYYEIKPEYRVGDWVILEKCINGDYAGSIQKLINVTEDVYDFERFWFYKKNVELRHATPEEIKAEQERIKWENIEPGDVLIHKKMGVVGVYIESNGERTRVKVGKIHPAHAHWDRINCELYAKKVNKDV